MPSEHGAGAFTSLYDFCERVDLRQITRSTIEALIKCGAFASMKAKRAQLLAILDRAVEMGQQSQQDKRMGQLSMFGRRLQKSEFEARWMFCRTLEEFPMPSC